MEFMSVTQIAFDIRNKTCVCVFVCVCVRVDVRMCVGKVLMCVCV